MARAAPEMALTVLVPPYWRDERGRLALERAHTDGYELIVQPIRFNGAYHLHYYPHLPRLMAERRPDIVHIDEEPRPDIVHIDEEPYNLATFHANRVARRSGARTLWFSWQNLHRRYPPPFAWFERYNLRHVDYALMGSHSAAAVWQAKGYRGRWAVIPQFGVDPDLFHPPAMPRADGPPHIAYVGRLVSEKGCDLLLEAVANLPGDWHLTFVGSGPEQQALRDQAAALGLRGRVTFRPWLPSTAMPDFYRHAMPDFYRQVDVLVLPSRRRPNWTEQFGRVLIEAMACQVAVVGAAVGEIPYVIGDAGLTFPEGVGEIPYVIGDAGLTFPEGDVEALRDRLSWLLQDPAQRQALGRAGRARVLAHYTQQRVAQETVDVYRRLMA